MFIKNTSSSMKIFTIAGNSYQLEAGATSAAIDDKYFVEAKEIINSTTGLVMQMEDTSVVEELISDYLDQNPELISDKVAEAIAEDTTIAGKEESANKAVDFSTVNDTKFPTTKAVSDKMTTDLAPKLSKGVKSIFCIDNGDFATLQDAINAATSGDVIMIGPKAGGWGDVVLKAGISLVGIQPSKGRDVVVGEIRFEPTTGDASGNTVNISNLRTNQVAGKYSVIIGGTAPYRLRFDSMWFWKSHTVTEDIVLITNNAAGSSCYFSDTNFGVNNGAAVGNILNTNCPYAKLNNCNFEGGNKVLHQTGGYTQITNSLSDMITSDTLFDILAGNALIGGTPIRSPGANASGVSVAAGSNVVLLGNVFEILDGTGFCVKGAGVLIYDRFLSTHIPVANVRNTKLAATLTRLTYTTAPTIV